MKVRGSKWIFGGELLGCYRRKYGYGEERKEKKKEEKEKKEKRKRRKKREGSDLGAWIRISATKNKESIGESGEWHL